MKLHNKSRFTAYLILLIMLVFLLTACASRFDSQEHAMIVNIHVISQDDAVCNTRDTAYLAAQTMYQDARWAWNYGRHLQRNEEMTKMAENLMAITKELDDRYKRADTAVSSVYCKAKFRTIHQATETILRVSARRER